jgi:metallo-beta-lactamase class B
MKALFKILLLLLLSLNVKAQPLKITPLVNNFYVYTTWNDVDGKPFPSNSLYLVTNDGVVLIDTPWDETQFQPLLDSIQKRHHKKAVLCIATHHHADRTAGLEYYKSKGIPTYTSQKTLEFCKKKHEKQAGSTFKKDTIFTVGGYKIQTYYPGKGHAPDNIVIWFEKEKILYGGCFVKSTESQGLGNLSDADRKAWPKSIQNVIKKFPEPQFIIPGHQDWTSTKSLQHTLNLLRQN